MTELSDESRTNQRAWDEAADDYQARHAALLGVRELSWGVWGIPESRLHVLGDVAGKDVLELGAGAAQWSILLAQQGGRPVALDISERQLAHGRELMRQAGVDFPLVHASSESVPLPDRSFDIIFTDHGGMTYGNPERTVPEAARLLRAGGSFAFLVASPWLTICYDDKRQAVAGELLHDYFELGRYEDDGLVAYQLPYGAWIRLFRRHGFAVEDLIELRPDPGANTSYSNYVSPDWARRWPAECLWKLRRET
ncbi:MAG TPA: class I SAM-dependent methyltransferase [Polyangiales bacterium]